MTSEKLNILVFPCGSENGGEIFQALRYSVHVNIFGASSIEDHGRFRFARYVGAMPNIKQAEFDRAFADLIRHRSIDMIFATHDSVAEYLAPRVGVMDTYLVNGNVSTTVITRQKSLTYQRFADCDWTPRCFPSLQDIDAWPVIVKPDRGQGGQGVTLAHNQAHAEMAVTSIRDPVLVEYLPGTELTIDCFTDRHRRLLWIGPRTRERVRAGIAMRSAVVPVDARLLEMSETINARLVMRGPWFFQVKQDAQGNWKLLEISSRVAGTMVLQRARGVNLPLMAVHDFMERNIIPLANPHVRLVERSIATRAELDWSFDHVYVDLDDTLIIDGQVVPSVVAFLYQCAGQGKHLHLITRHPENPVDTLCKYRICPSLFETIHHLTEGQSKAGYVVKDAIFIDNHFPERLEVSVKAGVPVLDVDAIEFFMT